MKKNKLLYENNEWTVDTIENMWNVIDKIGREELGLDYYAPRIELITFDQMLDAYSSVGMPTMYQHWSFGKSFITNEQQYRTGQMGLAYELVINSNPAVTYCMESNSATMQALVLAHACCGHVHFFKNNYLFKDWTDADGILTYLQYAKTYVDSCIETYGNEVVESLLDACHALQDYGVDTYKRGKKKSQAQLLDRETERLKFKQETYNEEYDIYPGFSTDNKMNKAVDLLKLYQKEQRLKNNHPEQYEPPREFPEENFLYFFEKRSLVLMKWEKEIVRIVRNLAQYFYPQRQTKMMNEGFASIIHYTIMNMLYDKGYITEGNMLEFLHSHTGVCCQHDMSSINPYALGFNIFKDLKRIALEPTEEDYEYFPLIAGTKDWLKIWKDCVANYRDESFIRQFLSPKVIRDMKLMNIHKDCSHADFHAYWEVTGTHTMEDIQQIRDKLAAQYTMDYYRPNLQISGQEWVDHTLHITHVQPENASRVKVLDEASQEQMWEYMTRLWGYKIEMSEYKNR